MEHNILTLLEQCRAAAKHQGVSLESMVFLSVLGVMTQINDNVKEILDLLQDPDREQWKDN